MAFSLVTPGRFLLALNNLFYGMGSFIADFNETHVKNPRWPPHAKFHNGQTMSLGAIMALSSMYFAFRQTASIREAKDSVWTAALIGSFYTVAGLSAILYPETKWIDPEFGEGHPQLYVFSGSLIANWLGYWLEMRRLTGIKSA